MEPEEPRAPAEPADPAPPDVVAAGEPPPSPRVERTGTGVMPAVVAGIIVAAALIAFVAQNTDKVRLHFLWIDFHTTPGVLVLAALFVGVVAAVIAGAVIRRMRRIRLNEREELQRLRAERATS